MNLTVIEKVISAKNVFMIVDESLKIKNIEAKRTKRIMELGKYAEYKLILNGTPITKNLMDVWSQMDFLSPEILRMSQAQFKNTFCKYTTITKRMGNRSYSKEYITGYENIDNLYSLIRHYVYECDLHLNITQNYKDIKFVIGEKEKELYNELKKKFLDDEALIWRNNNIFLEMKQKMQHSYCCTESKFKILDKLFECIPQDKTIIFCKYVDSNKACSTRFPKAKVLSYQKESLQDYNHMVYFDKIWDYALRLQAGRRTFRVGQRHDCKYYDLTGDVGLENLIDRNIQKKISMSEYFKGKTKKEINEAL